MHGLLELADVDTNFGEWKEKYDLLKSDNDDEADAMVDYLTEMVMETEIHTFTDKPPDFAGRLCDADILLRVARLVCMFGGRLSIVHDMVSCLLLHELLWILYSMLSSCSFTMRSYVYYTLLYSASQHHLFLCLIDFSFSSGDLCPIYLNQILLETCPKWKRSLRNSLSTAMSIKSSVLSE